MKKLIIPFVAVALVAVAVQVIKQARCAQKQMRDPRWLDALARYKSARERNAPQNELDATKEELGQIFQQLKAEYA